MADNSLFLFPHPDDELLVLGLINRAYKEEGFRGIWITNGDSNTSENRETESRNCLKHFGIEDKLEFWNYSQIDLFSSIINNDYQPFSEIYSKLEQEINESRISSVYTCAYEGGNIIHDVINYMVYQAINRINNVDAVKVKGYEFPQYHLENNQLIFARFEAQNFTESKHHIMDYVLSDEDVFKKINAFKEHKSQEVFFEKAKLIMGRDWRQLIKTENHRQISSGRDYKIRPKEDLFYELLGKEKTANGKYVRPIVFSDFIRVVEYLEKL